jgi:hypothetical protein
MPIFAAPLSALAAVGEQGNAHRRLGVWLNISRNFLDAGFILAGIPVYYITHRGRHGSDDSSKKISKDPVLLRVFRRSISTRVLKGCLHGIFFKQHSSAVWYQGYEGGLTLLDHRKEIAKRKLWRCWQGEIDKAYSHSSNAYLCRSIMRITGKSRNDVVPQVYKA